MNRDALERRYDGPIPHADPARPLVPAGARARLFDRLAGEVRGEVARRRQLHAPTDERLERLARALGTYRAHGIAWRA